MASFDLAGHTFSFSGHETFVFRYTWLKKAVDAVSLDPRVFTKDDAIVKLGVGKNMVRSIRHWGIATGVIEEAPKSRGSELKSTTFGQFIFGNSYDAGVDPFLEDPNTLWLLHWFLATNPQRSTTWQWALNMLPSNEFTRDGLMQNLHDEMLRLNLKSPSEATLKRDIDVFVRTYVSGRVNRGPAIEETLDCPLTELNLIEEVSGTELLKIRRGPKSSLGARVFAFCLLDFWARIAPGTKTLAFTDIAYSRNSPGNIFKLDENSLIEKLEALEIVTNGSVGYAEVAGLKQVYQQGTFDPYSWLKAHYEETHPVLVGV